MLPEQASPENRPDIQKILLHHQTLLNDKFKMFLDNSYKIKSLLFHLYFQFCIFGQFVFWEKAKQNDKN